MRSSTRTSAEPGAQHRLATALPRSGLPVPRRGRDLACGGLGLVRHGHRGRELHDLCIGQAQVGGGLDDDVVRAVGVEELRGPGEKCERVAGRPLTSTAFPSGSDPWSIDCRVTTSLSMNARGKLGRLALGTDSTPGGDLAGSRLSRHDRPPPQQS